MTYVTCYIIPGLNSWHVGRSGTSGGQSVNMSDRLVPVLPHCSKQPSFANKSLVVTFFDTNWFLVGQFLQKAFQNLNSTLYSCSLNPCLSISLHHLSLIRHHLLSFHHLISAPCISPPVRPLPYSLAPLWIIASLLFPPRSHPSFAASLLDQSFLGPAVVTHFIHELYAVALPRSLFSLSSRRSPYHFVSWSRARIRVTLLTEDNKQTRICLGGIIMKYVVCYSVKTNRERTLFDNRLLLLII